MDLSVPKMEAMTQTGSSFPNMPVPLLLYMLESRRATHLDSLQEAIRTWVSYRF
jgi:hypothetical protein